MTAALLAPGPALATEPPSSFGEAHGCDHIHRSSVAYVRIRALVRHTGVRVDKARVNHYATCVSTRAKAHRAHELARAFWAWRKHHATEIRANREWAYYRSHKLPWCTWGPESGSWRAAFDPARYTAKNPSSTAGGKYQFLDGTWYGLGGSYHPYRHPAAYAPPLEQERLAHKLYGMSGGSPWVNC